MILEWETIMRKRFYAWASEYLNADNITQYPPFVILCFLVENKVFTFEEERAELDQRKIIVHENVFDLARQALAEGSKE